MTQPNYTLWAEMQKEEADKEITEKYKIQERYCQIHKVEIFVPMNGICFSCKKQIFPSLSKTKLATELVTGCPICSRSYCD